MYIQILSKPVGEEGIRYDAIKDNSKLYFNQRHCHRRNGFRDFSGLQKTVLLIPKTPHGIFPESGLRFPCYSLSGAGGGTGHDAASAPFRDVEYLSQEIQKIKEEGFGRSMELQGDDEITLLCAVINEMSVQLREKEEREKRQQQSKNELITNVSHDLRRPGQKHPPKLRAGACHCKTHRGTPRGQGQCIITGTGTVRPSVSQIKEKSPLEKICMYRGEKGTLFLNKVSAK